MCGCDLLTSCHEIGASAASHAIETVHSVHAAEIAVVVRVESGQVDFGTASDGNASGKRQAGSEVIEKYLSNARFADTQLGYCV